MKQHGYFLNYRADEDPRLARAMDDPADLGVHVWCQKPTTRRDSCDTLVGHVQKTSPYLWVAHIRGPDPWLVRMRDIWRRSGGWVEPAKLPNAERENGREVWWADHAFLDDDVAEVKGRCWRHGPFTLDADLLRGLADSLKTRAESPKEVPTIQIREDGITLL